MTKAELDKKLKNKAGANKLTQRERAFLHSYLCMIEQGETATASRTEAMLRIKGDIPRERAASLGCMYFRNLKGKLGEIFDLVGMDELAFAYRVVQGTEATIQFQRKDEVVSYPDWRTRFNYFKLIAELKGLIGSGVNLNFNQTNIQQNIIVLPEEDNGDYDPTLAIKEFSKLQLPANGTNGNGKHE